MEVDPDLVIPDQTLSIRGGAIAPWRASMEKGEGWTFRIIDGMAKACDVDLDTPFKNLPKKKRDQVLFGKYGGNGMTIFNVPFVKSKTRACELLKSMFLQPNIVIVI